MSNNSLFDDFTPEEQAELGDLTHLEHVLRTDKTPPVDDRPLIDHLTPLLPDQAQRAHAHDWRGLLRTQIILPGSGFWWASGLLFALGLLLVLASDGTGGLLFALGSPLIAALGVAYLLRPATRGLRELERLSAVSALELFYARLLLVLAYNTILAVPLILLGWGQGADIVLWRVLLVWFGPVLCMTGAAFYITLRWNPLAGIGVPLGIWAGLILLGWRDIGIGTIDINLTADHVLLIVLQSDVLLMGSLLALVAGVALLWRTDHWVRRMEFF